MRVDLNVQSEHFIAHLLAVADAVANPEQLLGSVVKHWQHRLYQALRRVGSLVRLVRQGDAAIVGNLGRKKRDNE